MIRPATEEDLASIGAIYAHYVEHSVATFDMEPLAPEVWRGRWEAAREAGHPWRVAELGDAIAGYATASTFRPKAAYRSTVETTVYLRPDTVGRGLGRPLYGNLLAAAAAGPFHLAVAGITLPNPGSAALHDALGFTRVGTFTEIGHKHGAWRDVGWWQLPLDSLTESAAPPRGPAAGA